VTSVMIIIRNADENNIDIDGADDDDDNGHTSDNDNEILQNPRPPENCAEIPKE